MVPIRPLSGASVSVSEAVTATFKESDLYEVEGEAFQTVHLLTENPINVQSQVMVLRMIELPFKTPSMFSKTILV